MAARPNPPSDVIPSGRLGLIRRSLPDVSPRAAHRHGELELNLVERGEGIYMLRDRHYSLAPGTLVWLLPGEEHALLPTSSLDMWVVLAQPDLLPRQASVEEPDGLCRQLESAEALALMRLLGQLAHDDDPEVFNAGLAYFVRLAWRASRRGTAATGRRTHPVVNRSLVLLRSADPPESLTALAASCGISAPHLSRLLTSVTGHGFVELRNQARLEAFFTAYTRNPKLLSAALDSGFGSYAQFFRVFRANIGQSPKAWARRRDAAARTRT
jgi:AraC-like DNA-binding protein